MSGGPLYIISLFNISFQWVDRYRFTRSGYMGVHEHMGEGRGLVRTRFLVYWATEYEILWFLLAVLFEGHT